MPDGSLSQASPRFDGDVDPERVPERYRLGPAFVPKGRYLDEDFLQLELELVFPRTWLMACRLEELPGTGSYVEYRIGDRSILIVREGPDSIRAYHNACRHRGTRLATGRGRVGSIICPFHGWRWNLDGTIRLQLDPEEFVPRSDEDLGLQPVLCDTWGGFVFINMDRDAMPLHEYLDPIPTVLAPFGLENMRVRWFKSTIVPCNWKTVLDGFLEGYHIPGTHPQLNRPDRGNDKLATMKEMDTLRSWSPTTVTERHAMYQSLGVKRRQNKRQDKDPSRRPGAGLGEDPREGIANAVEYIYEELRALETERSVRAAQLLRESEVPEGVSAGEYHLQLYRELALADGLDWATITPQQWAAAGTAWHVFPNTIILGNQGSSLVYRARPDGLDPDRALFEIMCLEQIPVSDYDRRWEVTPVHYEDHRIGDFGQILTQDLENVENITVGMHSPSFDGHRLSTEQEMTIYNHHRVADRYLWGT
ncbi:aromatic ring-hydroxylating oxygenase subunit alpha [Dermatobacter hominis]|uniref:aromatic ring-hydroxylating oxygenase subunit alpha n=1 Tax=Dermatobacter hominis TaxID=2884263 RepID=UPI001D11E625|nr:aromatic ring-hydroxylating dioxygenase subunit alpha [Dermatobacter hominis]UDY36691.1 aromatic ring-hydroxylating dioxygenase subunit alpha [Dermatobacter hominis]